jgi:hypothetical protein
MRRTRTVLLIVSLLLWLALAELRTRPVTRTTGASGRQSTPLPGYSPTALVRSFEPPTPGTTTFWTIQRQDRLVVIYVVLR